MIICSATGVHAITDQPGNVGTSSSVPKFHICGASTKTGRAGSAMTAWSEISCCSSTKLERRFFNLRIMLKLKSCSTSMCLSVHNTRNTKDPHLLSNCTGEFLPDRTSVAHYCTVLTEVYPSKIINRLLTVVKAQLVAQIFGFQSYVSKQSKPVIINLFMVQLHASRKNEHPSEASLRSLSKTYSLQTTLLLSSRKDWEPQKWAINLVQYTNFIRGVHITNDMSLGKHGRTSGLCDPPLSGSIALQ